MSAGYNCFYCKNIISESRCCDCEFKYKLHGVYTYSYYGESNIFTIEYIKGIFLYKSHYNTNVDMTHLSAYDLRKDIDEDMFAQKKITSFRGYHITPLNIKQKFPIYVLIS